MKRNYDLRNLAIGLLLAAVSCLVILKLDFKSTKPTESETKSPSNDYAQCVQRVLLGNDKGTAKDRIEVAAALKDFLHLGPTQERAKSWERVQQLVDNDEKRQLIEGCARSAGIESPVRYVTIEVRPKREKVTVIQLGAAATRCTTDPTALCQLPVIDPVPPVRLSIRSHQYEAETRELSADELRGRYARVELKVREESILTITASESGHPFLGWIVVAPTFDTSGELTSQECFRDNRWEPEDCHNARADEYGRAEFRYTTKPASVEILLKDYRPATSAWRGTVEQQTKRIDVTWPGDPPKASAIAARTNETLQRQLPCGSQSSLEALIARQNWPATAEYRISLDVDEFGQLKSITGAPDELSTKLQERRLAVVSNCKPSHYNVRYAAKVN